MNIYISFLSAFLLFPICMFAGISGTYKVKGKGPDNVEYTGTVVIQKQGPVYTATWTFPDDEPETATGVKRGDYIGFVFREGNTDSYGEQLYKIDGKILKGPWARYGTDGKGYEKIKKVKHQQQPG